MGTSSEEKVEVLTHNTKVIHFFGRTTPIILQNDNGPCPLLAICNVLLLKNKLNLSPDIPEISQENLLWLVAERLIDSNSNVDNEDLGYVENQQQNIADAIDLLPRLTTGIDVNIKFKGYTDFEFTRECAIFDLLDIPLYHGWIVDPQDTETYNAVGSKSYNTIMAGLVGLETVTKGSEYKKKPDEDSVNFVAATTATLMVPSQGLSRGSSFNDYADSRSEYRKAREGELEEEVELLRALIVSEAEFSKSPKDGCCNSSDKQNMSIISNESVNLSKAEPVAPADTTEGNVGVLIQKSCQQEPSISYDSNDLAAINKNLTTFDTIQDKLDCFSTKNDQKIPNSQSRCNESGKCNAKKDVKKTSSDFPNLQEAASSDSFKLCPLSAVDSSADDSEGTEQVDNNSGNASALAHMNEITLHQGEVIKDFLKTNASQLTVHGLICLQEQLKERELCVFFRNNHFNTMFKLGGQLYILATDQGYINQPGLVWEKLNEVNGDTVFMTGNFEEFKAEEDYAVDTWDEQNTEYLAIIDGSAWDHSSFDSDLQLARALQEQEYEEEPLPNTELQTVAGGSGLVTGA